MDRFFSWRPVRFVRDMTQLYFDKRVSRSAAELAYFLILSLFPLIICINALVGMLRLDLSLVLELTGRFVPAGVQNILTEYLSYISIDPPGLLTAGLLMTLVSASAAFRALMNIMDDLYEQPHRRGFRQILSSVLYSGLLLVSIYVSGLVILTGEWFFRLFPLRLPEGNWPWLRFVLLFALMLVLVLLVYRLSAPKREPRPPVLTGAIPATAALVAASGIFSLLIGMSTRYSLVYGSLASVIILMVWLYLCGNILILGNVFNVIWYQHKKENNL